METREVPLSPSGFASNVFPERCVYAAVADEDEIKRFINMYSARREAGRSQPVSTSWKSPAATAACPCSSWKSATTGRTDKYGGSLENRARFYIELMSALKREVGDEIAVTTRFETDTVNGDHKIDHYDEGTRFVEIMHREGVGRSLGTENRGLRRVGRRRGQFKIPRIQLGCVPSSRM